MKTSHDKEQTVLKALRMQKGLIEKIEEKAKEENRNFSNMVNTILMRDVNYGSGN